MNRSLLLSLFGAILCTAISAVTGQDEAPVEPGISPPTAPDSAGTGTSKTPEPVSPEDDTPIEASRATGEQAPEGSDSGKPDSGTELASESRFDSPKEPAAQRPGVEETSPELATVARVTVWRLQFVAAREMQLILERLFPDLADRHCIQADLRTNSILARATADQTQDIGRIVQLHDQSEADVSPERTMNRTRSGGVNPNQPTDGKDRKAAGEAVERLDRKQAREIPADTLEAFRDALSEAFDERQRTQLAEIERLTAQLQSLAKQVRERESRRQEIIEQRLQQLLRELPGRSAGAGSSLRTVYTLPDFEGVLYFRADWCAPCLKMDPIIEQLKNEGAEFDVIDVEKNYKLVNDFEVDVLPSLVFVRRGKPHMTLRGITTAQEIRELLDSMNAESGRQNQSSTPGESLPEIEAITRLSAVKWLEMNIGSTMVVQDDARIQSVDGYSENIIRVQPDPGRQRPDRLSLEALELGITSLHIRNEHGVERTIEIRVQSDTRPLQTALDQAIPGHSLIVQPLNRNAVLLKGTVSEPKMADLAHSIAEQFFPEILDNIEVPGQSDRLSDPVLRNPDIRSAGASSETMLQQALRLAIRAAAIQAELRGETGDLSDLGATHPKARQLRQKLMAELNQLKAEARVYNDYVRLSEENARHQLELAEMQARQSRELVRQGVVPKQEAAAAESKLLAMKASVDQLNLILRQLQAVSDANPDGRPVENPEPVVEPSTNQQ